MLTKTLIFYAITFAVAAIVCVGLSFLFKRRDIKISKLHVCIGAVGFMIMLALVFWLGTLGFSEDVTMYIVEYMDVELYKVLAGALFFFIVIAIRYFALNFFYFNRDKDDKGRSFLTGFGFCGCALIAVYCLLMFGFIAVTAIGSKLESYNSGAFIFDDQTVISTFEDPTALLLVVLIFSVYTALCLIVGEFMSRHSTGTYKGLRTAFVYTVISLCEVVICSLFLFSSAVIPMYGTLIITVLVTAVALASVVYLYKYKEEKDYEKQFDDEE